VAKVEKAVLSTTAKARERQKKKDAEKKEKSGAAAGKDAIVFCLGCLGVGMDACCWSVQRMLLYGELLVCVALDTTGHCQHKIMVH
jgi:hypothetical protein